jgi:penicillin amidase
MKRLLAVVAIVLSGLALGGWLLARQSLPQLDGDAAIADLSGTVAVERDRYGVVTIRAQTRLDAAAATGFVHAQDRFFQMDLLRRTATGELSVLFGPGAVAIDRDHRVHRLRQVAEEIMASLPSADAALLEAYARGVNAGLAALTTKPFEYWVLRAHPVAWRPIDTFLVNFAMYFDLTDEDASRDASFAQLYDALPEGLRPFLLNEGTSWDAPLIGPAYALPPVPDAAVCDLRDVAAPRAPPRASPTPVSSGEDLAAGSNGWAVAAGRSRTGNAIVANDMHLELRVPNVWYRLRLVVEASETNAAPLDLTGVTLPGAPVIVAGSNGAIAWGFTYSRGDWSDLVLVRRDPEDSSRYWTRSGWRELETHVETIAVRGRAPVELRVRSTQWGPIVDEHRGVPRAVRWLAHEPEASNLRLRDLERASDVHEAVQIAHTVGLPPQNFMVADRNGDIAWTIMGRIPIRAGYDPRRPAYWEDSGTGWLGWLPSVAYPVEIKPPAGYLWTANARVVDGDALLRIGTGDYALGARAQRIRDSLGALAQASIDDMLAMQLDDRAVLHERWRDLIVALLARHAADAEPRRRALAAVLEAWDGHAGVGAAGYRLTQEFRRLTREAVLRSIIFGCGTPDEPLRVERLTQSEGPLWRLVNARPEHLKPPGHASWDAFLLAMVDETLASCPHAAIEACSWGELNRVEIRHPFAQALPLLSPLLTVHSGPLPGGQLTLRVQDREHGASERFAVSPGDEANGYFHMPGGQSGHPLSPYFRAGHEAWARGEPLPFLPGAPAHTLTLRPALTE